MRERLMRLSRIWQDDNLKQLATHCPYKLEEPKFTDPHTKVNVLLQCHFGRKDVSRELTGDLHEVRPRMNFPIPRCA